MRRNRFNRIASLVLICLGITAIVFGLFAYQLGLDNDPTMGRSRKILVVLGSAAVLLPLLTFALKKMQQKTNLFGSIGQFFAKSRVFQAISRFFTASKQSKLSRFLDLHSWLPPVLACLIVIVVYIWYLTAGTFTQWTPYSRYFDRQANAFIAGQLSLLEKPPAELKQLTDVYDWKQREGIKYIWDVSYYHGKYYLYWGPVPALLAAGIKLIHPMVFDDQYLVLIFLSGLTMAFAAFAHWLRRKYFPGVPAWTLFVLVLTFSFSTPVLWLINRPDVYEAAIASAQFFLMLGLYLLARGLTAEKRSWLWLIGSGVALGAAVGSRFTYAITVALLGLFIFILMIVRPAKLRSKLLQILALFEPLALCAIAIGGYNYARFGSILETGMRYQLTGGALPADFRYLFTPIYLEPNIYSSLFRPFKFSPTRFPFFFTPYVLDDMWPGFIHRPVTYYSGEPITGVFCSMPFLWLLVLPLIGWAGRFKDWIDEIPARVRYGAEELPVWLKVLFGGTFAGLFLTIMCFVMATMRYLADFVPLLFLITMLVVWVNLDQLKARPGWKKILLFSLCVLCLVTITFGLFINMQNGGKRFETNNPALYHAIAQFFGSGK
jgi:hypothetical protein